MMADAIRPRSSASRFLAVFFANVRQARLERIAEFVAELA
jgi:hypothetical protein